MNSEYQNPPPPPIQTLYHGYDKILYPRVKSQISLSGVQE